MKLWLVERTDEWDYDQYSGFVIRADSEETARALANEKGGWPGRYTSWTAPSNIRCVELTADGEAGIILHSFHAG